HYRAIQLLVISRLEEPQDWLGRNLPGIARSKRAVINNHRVERNPWRQQTIDDHKRCPQRERRLPCLPGVRQTHLVSCVGLDNSFCIEGYEAAYIRTIGHDGFGTIGCARAAAGTPGDRSVRVT